MLLSERDIELLEKAGYTRKSFVRYDPQGCAQLRNNRGHCVFYDAEKHRCSEYRLRPIGCRIYPVVYSEEEGVIVDDLCPMKNTVSKIETERKSKRLVKLLKTLDYEAGKRLSDA
jgi:Fe-S-cluster containining protein